MHAKLSLLPATALAVVALSAAATSVNAASFSISPGGSITITSLGLFRFEESGSIVISCLITLRGSLRTGQIAKTSGSLVGYITSPSASCNEERRMAFLAGSLPWHITYSTIGGTLPSAVRTLGLEIRDLAWLTTIPTGILGVLRCLFVEPLPITLSVTGTNPYTTALVTTSESIAPTVEELLNESVLGCPSTFTLRGSFGITRQTLTRLPPSTIEFTPAGEIELDSLDAITFTGGETRMSCFWNLRGSLTRGTIVRAEGAAIGSVTSTSHDHCAGGSVSAVLGASTLRYMSTTGTIPSEATAIALKLEGYAVNLGTFGRNVGCLYRGDLTGTLELSGANPYPTGLFRLSEPRLSFVSGARTCPATITATGTYWLGPEQELRYAE